MKLAPQMTPNQPNTKEVGFAFLKVLMTNMAMSMATHVKFNAFVLGKAKEQKQISSSSLDVNLVFFVEQNVNKLSKIACSKKNMERE